MGDTRQEFATINDIESLFRALTDAEKVRATALIPVIDDIIREEARNYGKDIDSERADSVSYANVLKSVVVDVVARTLMTSTDNEPMTQYSESAMGYSMSGSFLNPGGGIFIKESEYKRLGLRKQRFGGIELY